MRPAKPQRRPRRIRNSKRAIRDESGILTRIRDIIPPDTAVRHLCVKVRREAERSEGVHGADGCAAGVLPRVDGVRFARGERGVAVFPPEFYVVVRVGHHGVCCAAFAPAVAADPGVRVEARPALHGHPGVGTVVPGILLEGRLVDGEPDVYAEILVEGLFVGLA